MMEWVSPQGYITNILNNYKTTLFNIKLSYSLVFEGPVSRLEKDRDWTRPRLDQTETGPDRDWTRPRLDQTETGPDRDWTRLRLDQTETGPDRPRLEKTRTGQDQDRKRPQRDRF